MGMEMATVLLGPSEKVGGVVLDAAEVHSLLDQTCVEVEAVHMMLPILYTFQLRIRC